MKPLRDLIGRREFHALVFGLSLVLFSWPLISVSDLERIGSTFVYLFVCWTIVIILQLVISRCVDSQFPAEGADDREG